MSKELKHEILNIGKSDIEVSDYFLSFPDYKIRSDGKIDFLGDVTSYKDISKLGLRIGNVLGNIHLSHLSEANKDVLPEMVNGDFDISFSYFDFLDLSEVIVKETIRIGFSYLTRIKLNPTIKSNIDISNTFLMDIEEEYCNLINLNNNPFMLIEKYNEDLRAIKKQNESFGSVFYDTLYSNDIFGEVIPTLKIRNYHTNEEKDKRIEIIEKIRYNIFKNLDIKFRKNYNTEFSLIKDNFKRLENAEKHKDIMDL